MEVNTDSAIIVYAFRYALGRQSGAVYDVISSIMSNINNIEEKYKAIIVSETVKYLEEVNDTQYVPEDIKLCWKKLVMELLKILKKESKEWLINPLGGGVKEEILNKYRM